MGRIPGLRETLINTEAARAYGRKDDSVRIVAVVSGNDVDRSNFERRLNETGRHIFNRDGSTLVLSLREKTGHKTREGNFLGTLLAYRYIKQAADAKGISCRDFVTIIGMLFGRGERMSPITQALGDRKPATIVTPANIEIEGKKTGLTAIEEALLYFTPVVRYLEKRGFRGVLDKWGDETEIASVDLTGEPAKGESLAGHDVIKVISVLEITDELARQKDWVVFNEEGSMVAQLSRNSKDVLIERLKQLGIKPRKDGKYYAGISLGPVAVSYDVLDIASEVFAEEIEKEGVYFDFDPYFLMALAMENDPGRWKETVRTDNGLRELVKMIPGFFDKVQSIKEIFRERHDDRELKIKTLDLGASVYWADIGQHSAMREKFLALNDGGAHGIIARKIAHVPGERDEKGNIIVNSRISDEVEIKDSVLVNTIVNGKGRISDSVIMDSEFNDVDANGAFAVRSVRLGKTVLKEKSGTYGSLGADDLVLEEGMRHVSVFTGRGKVDMRVAENTNLRDKENTYNVPIFGNDMSFDEAYNEMFGVSMEELEERRERVLENLERIKGKTGKFKALRFGTSGLRDTVVNMTDMECYINTRGFIAFLKERGEMDGEDRTVAVGGDLRSSTPRIMAAVVKAVRDEGCEIDLCGKVPTPTLSYYAMRNKVPGIMVTGSHIPDDRNGIKFTKRSGEVLKTDEADILRNVARARNAEYEKSGEGSLFGEDGMFKEEKALPPAEKEEEAIEMYLRRYLDVFPRDAFNGKKIVLYQHSAVGRDIIRKVFTDLGAEVISVKRSDKFIPVDTEKVSEETRQSLRGWADEYGPFAIISTDGDSDRPLLADEKGEFLPGDKLGALVSVFLNPDFAAIPISANDAVVSALEERGIEVKQTKIGSPYVVAAMIDELGKNPSARVVSWESNGGFLLGSDWTIGDGVLKALPTRDAMLPLLSALLLAVREGMSVSELIGARLPKRYTYADVIDDKTRGCESYTADMGKTIVKMLSPKESGVTQVDFTPSGTELKGAETTPELEIEMKAIRDRLSGYFTKERGFDGIVSINFIDGIRIRFANDEVSHLRPSGNAPEFRNYATASTEERAKEIVEKRKEIIPQMISDLGDAPQPGSLGARAAKTRPGEDTPAGRVLKAVSEGAPLYIRPYKEPKVWGVGGTGEYWYGAGMPSGEKSSTAAVGDEVMPMAEIMEYTPEEILGKDAIDKFGYVLPLVKILTPKGRLSVQFHDTKNELWVVTGTSEAMAGEKGPYVIVGFSEGSVERYGKTVTEKYGEALL
ncbi:MAG: hypothetical protein U9R44_00435, partial [Candidatus Omnitrophota bacterium]|nr:hypothetical protein [Candidatus Omnitrophota bacterium]